MVKTLTQLATEVLNAKNQPHTLYELHIEVASTYSKYADTYKDLQIKKAEFWNLKEFDENGEQRERPLSDKAVEMKWRGTPDGKEDLRHKYILKGLEKLLGAIKSALYVSNQEIKNNY